MRELLDRANCDGWWFVPVGTFIAVFVAERAGVSRASACGEALRGLTQSWAQPLAVGRAEGELICTFTSAGTLAEMPMGIPINNAMNEAIKNAS